MKLMRMELQLTFQRLWNSLRKMMSTNLNFVRSTFCSMTKKRTKAKLAKLAILISLSFCTNLRNFTAFTSRAKDQFLLLNWMQRSQLGLASRLKLATNSSALKSLRRVKGFTKLRKIKRSGRQSDLKIWS